MKLSKGMGSSTLPGRTSMPDDEPPGSRNIRRRTNRKNIIKTPVFPKKPSFPRKPPVRRKRRTE